MLLLSTFLYFCNFATSCSYVKISAILYLPKTINDFPDYAIGRISNSVCNRRRAAFAWSRAPILQAYKVDNILFLLWILLPILLSQTSVDLVVASLNHVWGQRGQKWRHCCINSKIRLNVDISLNSGRLGRLLGVRNPFWKTVATSTLTHDLWI